MSADDTEALALLLKAAGIRQGTSLDRAVRMVRGHADAEVDHATLCDALRRYCRRLDDARHLAGARDLLAEVLDEHGIEIGGVNAPDSPSPEET